jgi:hypothetical protein
MGNKLKRVPNLNSKNSLNKLNPSCPGYQSGSMTISWIIRSQGEMTTENNEAQVFHQFIKTYYQIMILHQVFSSVHCKIKIIRCCIFACWPMSNTKRIQRLYPLMLNFLCKKCHTTYNWISGCSVLSQELISPDSRPSQHRFDFHLVRLKFSFLSFLLITSFGWTLYRLEFSLIASP